MRQTIRLTAVAGLLALASFAQAQSTVLWYDKPATDWEKEALPIGNGRIGAMVFGGVDSERLQISEKSLWTGGPGTEGGYDYGLPAESQAGLMHSIGKQLLEGTQLKPEDVAKLLGRKMHNYGDYQSFGDLIIERESDGSPVSGYRRELDLDTATARVSFKQGDAGYRREYFVSYPDQALVARWYGTSLQKLRVRFAVPDNRNVTIRAEGSRILIAGSAEIERTQVRRRTARGPGVRQRHARRRVTCASRANARSPSCWRRALTIACSTRAIATPARIRSPRLPKTRSGRRRSASRRSLRATHATTRSCFAAWRCASMRELRRLPTDKLRAQYGSGNAAADRQLEQLYFQYGRYLLIASSRARVAAREPARAYGTTRRRRRGMPTITSTSTCR